MSLFISVLRERGRVELPALPAKRGYLSRGPVQHRQLRVAHADGRAGLRTETGRIRPHVRRPASLLKPRRAGEAATRARAASTAANEIESGGEKHRRLRVRGF